MNKSDIITGQYVHISQTTASIGDRIVARLIDFIVLIAFIVVGEYLTFELLGSTSIAIWIFMLFFALPVSFYTFICETFFQGQTIGKHIRHIRVVNVDGSQPTMGALMVRWACQIIDIWTSGMGIAFIAFTKRRQRLGDIAAGTMVIHLENYEKYHLELDDFFHLKPNYKPVYHEAQKLNSRQAEIIEQTLYAPGGYDEFQVYILAQKVRKIMFSSESKNHSTGEHHRGNTNDFEFLETVLHDYQFFELDPV